MRAGWSPFGLGTQATTAESPTTLEQAAADVDDQSGPLVDPQADQLGMVRHGRPRSRRSEAVAASQEVLIDDGARQEVEALAQVGLGPASGDHHAGHHGGAGRRAADHSATVQEVLELPLDLGAEVRFGQPRLLAAARARRPSASTSGWTETPDRWRDRANGGVEHHRRGRPRVRRGFEQHVVVRTVNGDLVYAVGITTIRA